MARVMVREGTDLLHPRIGWAGPEAGTVESEFPLYQGLVAVGWRAVGSTADARPGSAAVVARSISVGAWLLGALALIAWVGRRLPGPTWPFLVVYCLSPLSIVFSRSIQPDPLAVAALLWGLERLDASLGKRGRGAAIAALTAALLLGLAIAVKGTVGFWLLAVVPLARTTRAERGTRWRRWGVLMAVLTVAGVLGIGWYVHASTLGTAGASFGIWGAGAHKWGGPAVWFDLGRWAGILGTFLGVTCTPLGAVLAGVGMVAARSRPMLSPFAWGFAGTGVAIIAVTEGFGLHNYYQLPAVAFASVLVGWVLREGIATVRDAPEMPGRGLAGALLMVGVMASTAVGYPFITQNLTVDDRPAAVARTAGDVIPPGQALVVVDRHAQTVLFAMDRRGWTRDTIQSEDLGWLEVDGAEYLLVTDASASYWSPTFQEEIAGRRPLVAQGADWVLFRLFAKEPDAGPGITSPAASLPEPGTPAAGQ